MAKQTNDYTGSCYIGVVGPDSDYTECRDSIQNMVRGPADELRFVRATKGYEARQLHLNNFIASKHDFILFCDHDQIFPADTLARLRGHGLPYVSGYYMRRRLSPLLPVWYEYPARNAFPYKPWTEEPERGKLHRLGASGWGCVLIHRAVILEVRKLLKGEPEIIEDDMDIWPYDLNAIGAAIRGLEELRDTPIGENHLPALSAHVDTLRREIRPLRCKKDAVGSDLRFPFFAREAGFTLWGDPDVRVGHMLHYSLTPDDWTRSIGDKERAEIQALLRREQDPERKQIQAARHAFWGVK